MTGRAPAAAGTEAVARWIGISAITCVAIACALWVGPHLLRGDLFSDDAAHHVFWLYRYADPALFPNDLSIEYFASPSSAPWGYRALYAVLAPFLDALLAAKIVGLLLLAALGWIAWQAGVALNGDELESKLCGLFAIVAAVGMLPFVDLLPPMGFQRSFAVPLTLLCLWALVSRRYRWVGISWLLAAMVYPVIIAVLGLTAAIIFLDELIRNRRMPDAWIWNVCCGGAAVLMVILGSSVPANVGPMFTFKQVMQLPEFGPHGRQDLFGVSWSGNWFYHHRTGLGWPPKWLLMLSLVVMVTFVLKPAKRIPKAAWIMFGVGVALWFVARLVMFTLYLPNRHSRTSIAAFAVVAVAAALCSCYRFITGTLNDKNGYARIWMARFAVVVSPLIVILALFPAAHRTWSAPIDKHLEAIYAYLETLPKDTLVAAHPELANYIPLRSKRSVLASTEESISFMSGYHNRLKPRIEASLRAAYATNWQELDDVLNAYGVGVVVSAPSVWSQNDYYAPYSELVRGLIDRGKREGFVLQHPTDEDRILFRSGEYYVIKINSRK